MSTKESAEPKTRAPMLSWRDIHLLVAAGEAPCISVYVPTSPIPDYREKNRILYKDQVKKVAEMLDQRDMDKRLRAELMEQLETVGTTDVFWAHQQYGLAIFLSGERFLVRRMMGRPTQLGIVADSFHVRPALRETSSWMRYQVLCVSMHDVALYDCSRETVDEVELHNDVPRGMSEAPGKTGAGASRKGPGHNSAELKRYFRAVDEAIRDHHNGPARLPLILAALPQYQGLFREVGDNPNLLEAELDMNPFAEIRKGQLGQSSWAIAEQALHTESDRWVEQYRERETHNEGESALEKVAYSATIGQVGTLLIEEDTRIEGTIVQDTGAVEYGAASDPDTDDVIDAIAEYVLFFDGEIRFIPGDRMPTDAGVAAMLRYSMQPA